MKILRPLALGLSPAVLFALGSVLGPFGFILLLPGFVLAIANSFAGGFGLADLITTSTWKNLWCGFAVTSVFLFLNFTALAATTYWRNPGN